MRRFVDATVDRCEAEIVLRDGSVAQCGRRITMGSLCTQHGKIALNKLYGKLGMKLEHLEENTKYRHIRTRRIYVVVEVGAKLQIDDPKYDMLELVVYRPIDDVCSEGNAWVRPVHEFLEKFERLE